MRRNKNKEKIGTWFLFLAKPLLRWLAAKWNSDDIETSFNQSHISNGNPREKVCFGGKFRGWQAEEKNLTAVPKDSFCWFCSSWGPAVAPDSRPDAGSLDVSSGRLILRNYSPRVCTKLNIPNLLPVWKVKMLRSNHTSAIVVRLHNQFFRQIYPSLKVRYFHLDESCHDSL